MPAPLAMMSSPRPSSTTTLRVIPPMNVPTSPTATAAPPVNRAPKGWSVRTGAFCTGSAAAGDTRNTLTMLAPADMLATMSGTPSPVSSPTAISTPALYFAPKGSVR